MLELLLRYDSASLVRMHEWINRLSPVALILVLVATLAAPAHGAGITLYKKDDNYVEIGGQIQVQYHRIDLDSGDSTDDLLLRRLRRLQGQQ